MSILIKGMDMPQEGFVEVLIREDGTVQKTGQSYRIDGTDYYTPYVGEMPDIYHAISVPNYDELLNVAKAMHTWIFLNSIDEKKVYDEIGISDDMNAFLGYEGSFNIITADKDGET